MSGVIVQLALGNVAASAALAGVAWLVHRRGRFPSLAHLLWVLALAKLITPPLLLLPVFSGVGEGAGASTSTAMAMAGTTVGPLLLVWLIGSVVVLAVSLTRIVRFDGLLRSTAMPAPPGIQAVAGEAAGRLGLRRVPLVYLSSARLAPMTWWAGGRVWVVLPATLPAALGSSEQRWVIAHELAHVKRRDHAVRWLEWLTCAAFWWNPVAWWARRNLHHDEEAACDALVLERMSAEPRAYAGALLAVVELLVRPAARAPAVATGIDGGALERRFGRILAEDRLARAPRRLAIGALAAALMLMPLGVGQAPGEAVPARAGGAADVATRPADPALVAVTDQIGADQYQPVAYVVDSRDAAVKRAERKLVTAQKAVARAGRAVGDSAADARKARRLVVKARQAVRVAQRAVSRLDRAPREMKLALRSNKRDLRAVTSKLKLQG